MAPRTTATPSQAAKMLDINREFWTGKTGIKVRPDLNRKRENGQPNKHPKMNRDIVLKTWDVDGEETNRIYIADPWPMDIESLEAERARSRKDNGFRRYPTRKYISRPKRRSTTRAQRSARRIMRRFAK